MKKDLTESIGSFQKLIDLLLKSDAAANSDVICDIFRCGRSMGGSLKLAAQALDSALLAELAVGAVFGATIGITTVMLLYNDWKKVSE